MEAMSGEEVTMVRRVLLDSQRRSVVRRGSRRQSAASRWLMSVAGLAGFTCTPSLLSHVMSTSAAAWSTTTCNAKSREDSPEESSSYPEGQRHTNY